MRLGGRTIALVCGLLALAAAPASADIRFDLARDYEAADVSSGLGAGAVAAADFNGDGAADLVISNCFGGGPSIVLNRGDGTFGAPTAVAAGRDACTVAAGDVDGDGRADIVTGSYGENALRVLTGRGDGTFAVGPAYQTGNTPMQVATADFDRDGRLDLAAVDNMPGDVAVFLARDSGFASAGRTQFGLEGLSLVTADFDRDGAPDIAVADGASGVFVLRGRGDGSFEPPVNHPVGFDPEYIAAGDLDGDAIVDLVTTNSFSNDLSLLFGRGDGTFRPEVRIRKGEQRGLSVVDVDDANGGAGVWLADFNRDGRVDIAATTAVFSGVTILAGTGSGRFAPAGDYAVAGFPEPVTAADFDGDGFEDLAVPGNLPAVTASLPSVNAGSLRTRVSVLLNASALPPPASPRTRATVRLRLSVAPGRARAGRRTVFRIRVRAVIDGRAQPVPRATVRLAGRRATTDADGRANLAALIRGSGVVRVRATKAGFRTGTTRIRIAR